jgi:hypothetical protein
LAKTSFKIDNDFSLGRILMNGRESLGEGIEWFIGDHGPRHVHVYDAKEHFLGRLDIERMRGIDAEQKVD